MARLHEYQGKAILRQHGLSTPRGGPAASPDEAAQLSTSLNCPVVLKIQAWTTGRAAIGGVAFADTPAQAREHAARLLKMSVGAFPVTHIIVEEKLPLARELFVSLSIDDRARAPMILLSLTGGTGIEERAGQVARIPCSPTDGPDSAALARALNASDLTDTQRGQVAAAVKSVFNVARATEARSVEINPLAFTTDGRLVAADCRMTIDDYAIGAGRHPELGIEIARELDHPPTELERIAYRVEQEDHRGTFYFAQMNSFASADSKGLIGFHGAGGGGSMMSMDAITNEGFTIANFCDTSGNPSPAKVYRAARIILQQPGLIGYFGSGSGVANQEQYWSAYGLAKAFWELELSIPAVIRLGGNTEDRAADILHSACKGLPATVECFKKNDPPARIAARFAELVSASCNPQSKIQNLESIWSPRSPRRPSFVGAPSSPSFAIKSGTVWINPEAWKTHAPAIISRSNGLLRDNNGRPALTCTADEFLAKDSDMIASEVECRRDGIEGDGGVFVVLDIPGLN